MYKNNKIFTSCFDNKRYILFEGINTLPYGYKDIPKNEKDKKNFFFWIHIRNLNITEKENNKYPPILINDIKNERLKEKLINILKLIDKIKDKNLNDFEKAIKNFANDRNYKLTNFLLQRHFIFKAVQEVNEVLTKNKERFLIDFVDETYNIFNE